MSIRSPEYVTGVVRERVQSPNEMPWLELKNNNANRHPRSAGHRLRTREIGRAIAAARRGHRGAHSG